MIAQDIIKAINAEEVSVWNRHLLHKDYQAGFASDLMSDALALIQESPEDTILITGLCNTQVLRTAEMLDLEMIIFVRGKKLQEDALEMAKDVGVNLFTTEYTMYETCGILYSLGLGGIHGSHSA